MEATRGTAAEPLGWVQAFGVPAGREAEIERATQTIVAGGVRTIAVLPLRLYQLLVSPLFPASCKYHPSCSQYAIDALRKHGLVKGSALAGWRLLRCNPWSRGGVDYA